MMRSLILAFCALALGACKSDPNAKPDAPPPAPAEATAAAVKAGDSLPEVRYYEIADT